jgi:hypothetical protein
MMEDLMNKINVLFLSSLVLVGPSAYGMRQGIADIREGFEAAGAGIRDAADNLPNRMYDNMQEDRQDLHDAVKGFRKNIDDAVGDVFGNTEALFGSKGQYNTYINKLNRLKDRAKNAQRNHDFEFDAHEEFQDLIDQEAAAIEKQQRKQQYNPQPAVTVRGKRVRQPQTAQQRVQVAKMPTHVESLQRAVDAFDNALNAAEVNNNPRAQQNGRNNRRNVAAPVVNNRRSLVTQARKQLNTAIASFKDTLESQRDKACDGSPFNEVIYGGSSVRSWVAMGALALGALLFGQTVKDSATGQRVADWFTQGKEFAKTAFTAAFDWITAKFTA